MKTKFSRLALRQFMLVFSLLFFRSLIMAQSSIPVTWTGLTNVTINGDTLIKTSTTTGWNAGAYSIESIGDGQEGWTEMTAIETTKARMFGLSKPDTYLSNSGYTYIDYAIYLTNTGTVNIYESGTSKFTGSAFASGDVFRIQRVGNEIRYLKNGAIFYISTLTYIGALFADCSINVPNGTIYSAKIYSGSSSSGGGDNLGNHTALNNIRLNNYWLSGDGGNEGVFVDANGGTGIGTNAPTATLDVNGTFRFRGGSPASGRVLTSDASGLATWTPLPPGTGSLWTQSGTDTYYNSGTVWAGLSPTTYADGSPKAPLEVGSFMNISRSRLPHIRFIENGSTVARIQGGRFPTVNDEPYFIIANGDGGTKHLSVHLNSGNVGIGTGSNQPQRRLHLQNTAGDALMRFQTANSAWDVGLKAGSPDEFVIANSDGAKWFILNTSNKTIVMGIPDQNHHSLAVQGKMTAQEIKVKPDPLVPDYVFHNDYKLQPLNELADYIKKNNHLPGIPSAQEIEKADGIYLGEMSYKLLEKVEELTLHMIQLKKENEELKARIQKLEK